VSKAKRTCGECKHWLKQPMRGKKRTGNCCAPIPASVAEDYRVAMEANSEVAEFCDCFKRKKPKA